MPLQVNALEDAYTAADLVPILNLAERTIRRLMQDGEIEYITVGRTRYVPPRAVVDYFERHYTRVDRRADRKTK